MLEKFYNSIDNSLDEACSKTLPCTDLLFVTWQILSLPVRGHLYGVTGSAVDHIYQLPEVKSPACLKGVLSFTLPFWGLLGPFSLPCAQK